MSKNIVAFNVNGKKYEVKEPKDEAGTSYTPTFVSLYRNQSVTSINVNGKRYERTYKP